MNALAAYGLLADGLIFGALAAALPFGEFRARVGLAATALALTVGIAPLLHGGFGTPSLTLLQLALLQLTGRTAAPLTWRPALGLLLLALFFYPAALGVGGFDPYAAGYQPAALLVALLPLAGVLWWKRHDGWLLILAIDLAGYAGGLFANLWDALFDPLLVLLALFVVGRAAARHFSGSRIR
ncbi:MAG: hypothetical protein ACM3X0_04880 [Bacteroidota bacterium]